MENSDDGVTTVVKGDYFTMIRNDINNSTLQKFTINSRASGNLLKKNADSTAAVVRCLHYALRHAMAWDTDYLRIVITKCRKPNTMTFQTESGGGEKCGNSTRKERTCVPERSMTNSSITPPMAS